MLLTDLLSKAHSTCFLIPSRTTSKGRGWGTNHSGLNIPTSIFNQENDTRDLPTGQPDGRTDLFLGYFSLYDRNKVELWWIGHNQILHLVYEVHSLSADAHGSVKLSKSACCREQKIILFVKQNTCPPVLLKTCLPSTKVSGWSTHSSSQSHTGIWLLFLSFCVLLLKIKK